MTPKWPLTPDFLGEHVLPFPSNPVSFGDATFLKNDEKT